MADLAAFLSVSHSNSFYFTNACNNDMLLYPESSSQSIHIGTMSNSASVLQITSTAVNVIGDLNFTGALKANGGSYQWSNNSSNLFVMGSNVAIGRSNTTRALHVVGDVEFGSNIYMAQQPLFRGIRVMPFSNTPILNIASAVTAVQGYSNDANGVNLLLPSALGSSYLRVLAGATELARLTGNGLLGIGTSQPSSALHLYSNAAVGITLCNPATGAMPAYVGLSNSGELLLSCGSNLSAVFQTSNVERMRIDGNGYVGIGTPQPTSALHLASNAAAPVSITLCNAATGGRPAAITLSNTGDLALSCASNSSIAFQTSNAERMRIGSNGYVGIGTSLPTSALHLASNAFAAVGMTLCNFATGAMPASIVLSNSGDLLVSCGSNYSVAFQTSNIERLRINSNGNVGIGTPFPTSALHLASNAAASVMVTLCNAATGGMPALIGISNSGEAVFACTSNLGMSFQTNNIERLRINSNGNVGIGTPFPTSALHLASNALANVMVTLCNTATGAMPARFGLSNSGEFVVACTSNLGMSFQTNNVERIRVTSNGNVGIGTANPSNVLHVIGNVQVSGAVYNNYGTLNIPNGTAAGWYRIASAGSGIGKITLQVASVGKQEFCTFVHGQTWIDSSFIKVESFVGRNGSPQNITQIRYLVNQSSGASYIDAYLANSFFSTFALTLSATVVDNSASTALVLAPTAAAVDAGYTQAVLTNVQVNAISYNSANAMTITSGGYVGIGTSSPAKPLEVFAGTSGAGYLDAAMFTQNIAGPNDGMSQGPAIVFKVINNNNASWNEGRIRTVASPALGGQLIFETASQNASDTTEKMRLTHSGWLGIGTTGPVAPLHVAGTGGTNYSGNYFTSSGSLANGNSPGNLSSIYATNWITSANGFIASSDARIKNVLTPSSLESDLDLIDSIDVVRFDYIDKVSYPDSKIGFIAQQVQQRLPSAVKRSANYIPNVYKFAEAKNNAITFEGRIENIAASDKLRVITCENVGVETSVISVGNDSVTVKETIEDGRVFVYGTQVDDFLSVDYDMMSSLAFSGVQQLNRIVKRLESRIARIEERLALQ